MPCPIDPNVKIDETDTRVHIAITSFPRKFDTIRFTPLTVEGRRILKIGTRRASLSCSNRRGYDIADFIGSIGVSTVDEILESPDCAGRYLSSRYAGASGYDG